MKQPVMKVSNFTFLIEPGVQQQLTLLTILSLESGDIVQRNVDTVLDPLLVSEPVDLADMIAF